MTDIQRPDETGKLVEAIIEGILEVKGHEITCLDMRDIEHSIADYFVICHGTSHTQVEAIGRSVEKETKKRLTELPWHTEGMRNSEWALMDYGDVVVHIFYHEAREKYGLEELWADAKTVNVANRA